MWHCFHYLQYLRPSALPETRSENSLTWTMCGVSSNFGSSVTGQLWWFGNKYGLFWFVAWSLSRFWEFISAQKQFNHYGMSYLNRHKCYNITEHDMKWHNKLKQYKYTGRRYVMRTQVWNATIYNIFIFSPHQVSKTLVSLKGLVQWRGEAWRLASYQLYFF